LKYRWHDFLPVLLIWAIILAMFSVHSLIKRYSSDDCKKFEEVEVEHRPNPKARVRYTHKHLVCVDD